MVGVKACVCATIPRMVQTDRKVWNYLSMKPKQILQATTLLAAAASLVMSVYLYFSGDEVFDRLNGIFVGVWVPSILSLGAFLVASSKDR